MKCNVGNNDRFFRVTLGLILLAMVFVGPRTPWGYIGIIPLLTGLFRFCPLYALFGWTTDKRRDKPQVV